VVGLWRYPVKSMMGEELNAAEITDRGVVGDRRFAVVDAATGKVADAKNPRNLGQLLRLSRGIRRAFRAGSRLPAVRLTLADGTVVTNEQADVANALSAALGREVELAEAAQRGGTETAEEYRPDIEGLEHRDTVTDLGAPRRNLLRPRGCPSPHDGDHRQAARPLSGRGASRFGASGPISSSRRARIAASRRVLPRSSTLGFTTLIGLPAACATI
jgi:MOSC N-terminal beta barrel domain